MKFAPSQKLRRRAQEAGLTLIELLVVLVILTGIGGLLVPTINNDLTRTHIATCATTFPEVHQMMQRVQLEFGEFGTDFDSGVDTAATGTPVNASASTAPVIQSVALTDGEALALAAVGITSVVDHDATAADYNVTFNIGATQRLLVDNAAAPTAASADSNVVTLTAGQAGDIFLPNTNGEKYVWFGIGRDWSLLGALAPEPPVHFGDTAGVLPDEVHSRFGIVMKVAENNDATPPVVTALERAEFARVSFCIDGRCGLSAAGG